MKVKLEDGYRKLYTLEELDQAKAAIASLKEDDMTAKDAAEYAANEFIGNTMAENSDYLREILTAKAETSRNNRIWNYYGEATGHFDIWVSFLASTEKGFIEGGAYLSDIYGTGVTPYKQHMYIRRAEWK